MEHTLTVYLKHGESDITENNASGKQETHVIYSKCTNLIYSKVRANLKVMLMQLDSFCIMNLYCEVREFEVAKFMQFDWHSITITKGTYQSDVVNTEFSILKLVIEWSTVMVRTKLTPLVISICNIIKLDSCFLALLKCFVLSKHPTCFVTQ